MATASQITRHVEPADLGGETYHRCTECKAESIYGADSILHREECSGRERV